MSNSNKLGLQAGRPSDSKKAATLASLADKAPTVRVNFDLDRELHTKLKVYAAQSGKTIAEILRDLVVNISS
jgi:hypothetical protein